MSEDSPVSGSIGTLWALAKHWQLLADDTQDEAIRESLLRCVKQLRQRLGWLNDSIAEQEQKERREEYVAVLESLMEAGWISRFTIVDDEIKYWLTSEGRQRAQILSDIIRRMPQPKRAVRIQTLETILGWIVQPSSEEHPQIPKA